MTADRLDIRIIVAVCDDNAIGRAGDQPFYISGDLKRFKAITMGYPVVMGRRSFEALPRGPLPGRHNIVVTRNTGYHPVGTTVIHDLDSLRNALTHEEAAGPVFIIGGGQLYAQAFDMADTLIVTHIHATVPDADTHFPLIDRNVWQAVDVSPTFTDDRNGLTYNYVTYTRR